MNTAFDRETTVHSSSRSLELIFNMCFRCKFRIWKKLTFQGQTNQGQTNLPFTSRVFDRKIWHFQGLINTSGHRLKQINRHNLDLDERKNGVTRTWMRWNFYRKLFVFSSHFMSENDVKRSHWFKNLTSFPAMEDENNTDFSLKVLLHSNSCQPIFQNWILPIQIEVP